MPGFLKMRGKGRLTDTIESVHDCGKLFLGLGHFKIIAPENVLIVEHALIELIIHQTVELSIRHAGSHSLIHQRFSQLLREYAQRAHGIERLNILRLADDDIRRLAGGEHGIEPHRKALAPVDILPFQFYIRKRLFDSFVNQIRHTGIAGGFSGEHRQQHLFLLPRRFRRRHNGAS